MDIKTSCGKTWAVNMIVSHETLQRDDATALFIIPNQSILFENIQDICETNYKKYKYAKHMIDLETKNWKACGNTILETLTILRKLTST